jgi:Polyketide cyclase / dehydrase and lipid transport
LRINLRVTGALWCIFFITRLPAHGEVIDSSAGGFTVKNVIQIAATQEAVYDRVVHDVGHWWSPDHTFSGEALNLSIDARANGCFCEKLNNGGSVRHMTVIYADPGKVLRLDGAIGPLQSMGVTGSMTWTFTKSGEGTKLDVTYSVGGYNPHGLQKFSVAADFVLNEQIGRLKNLIETGTAAGKK